MIFGKTGLQGLPTWVSLFLWVFSRQGATGVPLFTTWDSIAGLGRAPIPGNKKNVSETFRAGADPGIILSVLVAQLVGRLVGDEFWEKDYGWGVRICRPFGAHGMSSVWYGARLGDLKENWFLLFSN
jgi:hypothetical protein